MHVLYVIDSVERVGGAEAGLTSMAPHLVKAGVRLDIAYLKNTAGFQSELAAAGATLFGVHRSSRARRVVALRQLLRERRPDLVHTTLYEADVLGRSAALTTRTPVVSSLVNSSYGPEHLHARGLNPWKVRAAQGVDALTAQGTRRFHALTHHVADAMAQRLRISADRIDVIPRGRDPLLLGTVNPERRARVRAAVGVPQDAPVVFAAARQQYQKGLDILLEAWPQVRQAVPEAVLLLAGSTGAESARLRTLARAADPAGAGSSDDPDGADACIRFLGPRDDVYDLMAAADVFTAPSRWEGLGSAAMEAMGVGVPLVCSDVPALRETVGSPEHALLVPPEQPEALAKALIDALTNSAAAAGRAEAARARFLERFTLEQVTELTVDFYRRALSGHGHAR